MIATNPTQIHATSEATGFIPAPGDKGKPITVIGTNSIRAGFDATCLQQALNARSAPGVTDLVLNPDAHAGYGAPVGCVLTSPTHVYPGPVGVDIKCSMSFLQLDLPADQVADKTVRRALIDAILERTPTGPGRGQRSARKARKVGEALGVKVATDGASPEVLHALGIPLEWAVRCEDAAHTGHDGTNGTLSLRLDWLRANQFSNFLENPTSSKKLHSSVRMAAVIISANAKWCACSTTTERVARRKCSACAMVAWDSCRTAARADSVTRWQADNSARCSRSSPRGTSRCRATTTNWSMRRLARPRPPRISTIWHWARTSRP